MGSQHAPPKNYSDRCPIHLGNEMKWKGRLAGCLSCNRHTMHPKASKGNVRFPVNLSRRVILACKCPRKPSTRSLVQGVKWMPLWPHSSCIFGQEGECLANLKVCQRHSDAIVKPSVPNSYSHGCCCNQQPQFPPERYLLKESLQKIVELRPRMKLKTHKLS